MVMSAHLDGAEKDIHVEAGVTKTDLLHFPAGLRASKHAFLVLLDLSDMKTSPVGC